MASDYTEWDIIKISLSVMSFVILLSIFSPFIITFGIIYEICRWIKIKKTEKKCFQCRDAEECSGYHTFNDVY